TALHGAAPEGPDRASGARRAIRHAGEHLRDRLLERAGPGLPAAVAGSDLRAALDDRVREAVRRPPGAAGSDRDRCPDALLDGAEHGVREVPGSTEERGGGLP